MKLPIVHDGIVPDHAGSGQRPVRRVKPSMGTSLCAGASASWALVARTRGPYAYARDCFCLSPELHGAQFRDDVPEPAPSRGHC
jgi:hypothetical protein